MSFIVKLLASNRVKAVLVGLLLAFGQKHFPSVGVDESLLTEVYALLLAFIIGDTVRPIDPRKPGAFSKSV